MEIMQGNRMSGALIVLAVNSEKTKYIKVGSHQGLRANEHTTVASNSYEKVKTFKSLGSY